VAVQPTPSSDQAMAQLPCSCPVGKPKEGEDEEQRKKRLDDVKKHLPAGVIWCAPHKESDKGSNTVSAQMFAEQAAPILWFSPNEPLFSTTPHLPQPLPGDETKDSAVVYYRISEVLLKLRGQKSASSGNFDRLELDNIKKLTLKYYFYYSKDIGFGGHLHDLESVRFDINFTVRDETGLEITDTAHKGPRYYVANISKIIGAAHGVTWYGNQLDLGKNEKDTSLPVTLFVEEGKHATSPDRNADGFYSPGYDVNYRYSDAWGVRDLLGSGQLGSAKYEGAMTKPRRPEHMIKVKPTETNTVQCLLQPYTGEHKDKLMLSKREYKLTPARVFETKKEQDIRFKREQAQQKAEGKKLKDDKIAGWMKDAEFGEMEDEKYVAKPPKQPEGDSSLLRAWRFGNGVERNEELWDAIPITLRAEGRQYGFSILPPVGRYQVFFLDGYFLPKINVMFPNARDTRIPGRKIDRPVRFSLEAMYTPSASRTFDWYTTAGAEWERPDQSVSYATKFVTEGGLRFRFNLTKLLVGGRIGLRVTGFPEARSPRLIFELGTGAF
jgi:hypothetical protein